MGLAIGVNVGEILYFNDEPVEVLSLEGFEKARIRARGKIFDLTDQVATEIMPSVMVMCGKPLPHQVRRHMELTQLAQTEVETRMEKVEKGEMTEDELQALPPVLFPHPLPPRLLIEAPREIVILRQWLYRRSKREKIA